jgi:dTDP-4-dehydrorhamnose reductase
MVLRKSKLVERTQIIVRTIIVGQSGQLGRELLKALSTNHEIIDVDYKDLTPWNLKQLFESVYPLRPDLVINSAAWTNVDSAEVMEGLAFEVNAIWPENLALLCKELAIPFFQFSTDYVFSGEPNQPIGIERIKNPTNAYGRTKAVGEDRILKVYEKGSYIFRTAWLYSKHRRNFAKTMVKLALQNKNDISVVSDQYGQPTSAIDLANQINLCLSSNLSPGIYHATNSGSATWNEFAREIFLLLEEDPERVLKIDSKGISRAAARPNYSVLSHECWEGTGIEPMRDWRNALATQIEEIAYIVKFEENL